jgi:cytochrome bd-type quinol oxidase subunit 1
MNYPVWYLPGMGGSLLIAIIAIIHVVIAHFAVGGGLFLVLTEHRAYRTGNKALLEYVKSHTWFFLLLTMVMGGVTGVGIWFIISLVHPAATSLLIHQFVFAWAIEWVFFIAEIVALLIYHYRFEKMSRRDHLILGWLYFIFAWLSLFVINGILAFMLTPGKWIETGSFWHAFFNPGFLPTLIFRSAISAIIAGVFGLITALFRKDEALRKVILKWCAGWMYIPLAILAASAVWYTFAIDPEALANILHQNPESSLFRKIVINSSVVLFGLGLFTIIRFPRQLQGITVTLLVVITFAWMGGFEYLREIARKPYVIYETLYSNGIRPDEMEAVNSSGFLSTARWSRIKEINNENLLEAGSEIFRLQCLNCHTEDNYNGVKNKIELMTERGIEAQLTGMGRINSYMPPFAGTESEKRALAAWLYRELLGNDPEITQQPEIPALSHNRPSFDISKDKYVLLLWNDIGMKCISDNDKILAFLPPANTLNAQLVKRAPVPEIIMEGYTLKWETEEQHLNPQNHTDFWEYDSIIYGKNLPEATGLTGSQMAGEMRSVNGLWIADKIPLMPYRDDGIYNPYPLITVTASDPEGNVVARTSAVAPVSTEMGCRNCHGGEWAWNGVSGLSDITARNILTLHDKYSGTTLSADAAAGKPRLCQECHADPVVGRAGKPGILSFSASIHGFHANYLTGMYQESCNLCHPSDPASATNCMRGRHAGFLDCTTCHGTLEDHALALLKGQTHLERANRLAASLNPVSVASREEINPRTPWLMEPDCMGCHTNFNIAVDGFEGSAYNKWVPGAPALYRMRRDNQGMMCAACHGSPHAIYGAYNNYDPMRDNIQPLQYQGLAGTIGTHESCIVCHTIDMETSGHHRNQINRLYEAVLQYE